MSHGKSGSQEFDLFGEIPTLQLGEGGTKFMRCDQSFSKYTLILGFAILRK